ncbi:glucosyltransferase domain-containing protein [Paraburkholderia phytofirmans]|uniref:Glucosyl transferase GtrII n=1 Tax=Paraburkholderia phytofirmans (strain DSM 17436 / LMG 22146 / PsJN) TaxID=398527 RepID=B2T997_PARPJ|nr:glucosyltransferase domain-containing protein [Paraburkholderia phytofirmans]ACD20999.1 hypothetical protein Bphyt_6704 [Paraburkholderia phytofirmans PsJN]
MLTNTTSSIAGRAPLNRAISTQKDIIAIWILLALITSIVVLPNVWIYSIDDIAIRNAVDPLQYIVVDQGSNGRFMFSATAALLRTVGFGPLEFLSISLISIIVGLPALFIAIIHAARLRLNIAEIVIPFCAFVLCGCMFDVYQFSYASIQVGAGSLLAALALYVASSERPIAIRLIVLTASGWLATGFYQIYPYLLTSAAVAIVLLRAADGKLDSIDIRKIVLFALTVAISVVFSIFLYLATNKFMKAMNFESMANYPLRPFGIGFARANVTHYLDSIKEILNPNSPLYGYFYSKFYLLGVFAALIIIGVCKMSSVRNISVIMLSLTITVLMLPNPTNILLQVYWPTPRSLSPVSLIIGALFIGGPLQIRSEKYKNIFTALLVFCVSCQALLYMDMTNIRRDQQDLDFQFAKKLIDEAEQNSASNTPITIKTSMSWRDNTLVHQRSFDYAGSLFSAEWSTRALFGYLSGRRVTWLPASENDCAGVNRNIATLFKDNTLITCSTK